MKTLGRGVREIRIKEDSGAFRIIYVATILDAVLVLHAFQKRTRATPQRDIDLAAAAYVHGGKSDGNPNVRQRVRCTGRYPAEAANLKARSELLLALKARVRSWNLSQEVAANRLGITRPRLNDLLQGKMSKLSLDALVILATASGLAVHIQVAEAA
jgi:predicted XRE-type DNA-binding protein